MEIVVVSQNAMLGLELLGGPARSDEAVDLERYRRLQRAGVSSLPLSYRRWQQDRASCLSAIQFLLHTSR